MAKLHKESPTMFSFFPESHHQSGRVDCNFEQLRNDSVIVEKCYQNIFLFLLQSYFQKTTIKNACLIGVFLENQVALFNYHSYR